MVNRKINIIIIPLQDRMEAKSAETTKFTKVGKEQQIMPW